MLRPHKRSPKRRPDRQGVSPRARRRDCAPSAPGLRRADFHSRAVALRCRRRAMSGIPSLPPRRKVVGGKASVGGVTHEPNGPCPLSGHASGHASAAGTASLDGGSGNGPGGQSTTGSAVPVGLGGGMSPELDAIVRSKMAALTPTLNKMLANPGVLEGAVARDPNLKALMDANPSLAGMLAPEKLRSMMQMVQNPALASNSNAALSSDELSQHRMVGIARHTCGGCERWRMHGHACIAVHFSMCTAAPS
eukprot:364640-Chlamydomonas_euryale.AAC.6